MMVEAYMVVKVDIEKIGIMKEDANDQSRRRSNGGAAEYHLRYRWP